MKEKRKLERRNFIYDIEVLDRGQAVDEDGKHPALGDLADVTVEGIMVVSDEPVAEETVFQLQVVLPGEIDGISVIDVEAKSIRCSKTIHETIFLTGFKITQLDESTHGTITRLIDEYAV